MSRQSMLAPALVLALVSCGSPAGPAPAPEPVNYTSPRALDRLGRDTYLGFTGGLYPGGSNQLPASHRAEAMRRLERVVPRDANGNPSANGRIVFLSIGYSNATQEFCSGTYVSCGSHSFMGQAVLDPAVNHGTLVMVNGAAGGQTAELWDDAADANYDRIRTQGLTPNGLSEAQVQVVWWKMAHAGPKTSLPASDADAYTLLADMGDVLRALGARYPNLQLVLGSSRTYGGFATTTLNPEPYAFESGLALKWLIEAQALQLTANATRAGDVRYDVAPWIGWGPYIWAGGATSPQAGWTRADFASDGTHPSISGVQKIGRLLLEFLKGSELSQCWFLAGRSCA